MRLHASTGSVSTEPGVFLDLRNGFAYTLPTFARKPIELRLRFE